MGRIPDMERSGPQPSKEEVGMQEGPTVWPT